MAWAPFFMVAVMLLSQALLLPLDPGEDPVEQVIDVVQGLALCLLLVLCPWLLWELVDFVGDRIGGPAASGGVAGRLASTGSQRGAAATGGAAGAAIRTMMANAREFGRGLAEGPRGGSAGGGQGGGADRSSPSVPRPEAGNQQIPRGGSQDPADDKDPHEKSSTPGASVDMRGGGGGRDGIPGVPPPANLGRVVAGASPHRSPSSSSSSEPGVPTDTSTSSASGGRGELRMPPPAD
jgi:hypothetical protein